jgi:hypothetical protein
MKLVDRDGDSIQVIPLRYGVEIEMVQNTQSGVMTTVVLTDSQVLELGTYLLSIREKAIP